MHKRIMVYLVWSLLLTCSRGEEADQTYDLDRCLREALTRNPSLQKQMLNISRAEEDVTSAGAVYDTTVSLSGGYEDTELSSSLFSRNGNTETWDVRGGVIRSFSSGTRIGLEASTQGFDFMPTSSEAASPFAGEFFNTAVILSLTQPILKNAGGSLDSMRIHAAELGVDLARLDYLRYRDQMAFQVHAAYWDKFAADKLHAANQASVDRAASLLEINRKKSSDGLLDETDILAAEAVLATREVDVLTRKNRIEEAGDVLKQLMFLHPEEWDLVAFIFPDRLDVENEPEASLPETLDKALSHRPDLLAIYQAEQRALEVVEIKKQGVRPDLSVSGALMQGNDADTSWSDSVSLDKSGWSVRVALEVPIFRDREKAELRQAELELEQIQEGIADIELLIERQCRSAVRNLDTAWKTVAATKKALDLQTKKLSLEEEKLRQGRSNTRIIMDYQDDLEFAENSYLIALSRYRIAAAELALVRGDIVDPLLAPLPDEHGVSGVGEDAR
ncbi:MAG: TolC family protein [Verrucomicrobia bacterium]|nr:TolC family protein [Verrucomicrobiota bacterium]